MNGRHVDTRIRVDEELAVGRMLNRVVSVAFGQGDQSGAVEVDAVEMNEIGILAGVLAGLRGLALRPEII